MILEVGATFNLEHFITHSTGRFGVSRPGNSVTALGRSAMVVAITPALDRPMSSVASVRYAASESSINQYGEAAN
jgi:hypothetical protein